MKDVILLKHGVEDPKISCLDRGFVQLIDCMPRLIPDGEDSADFAIPKAARLSYMRMRKSLQEDITLIRYLKRNNHTSPFEKIKFQFIIKLPIFVARQLIRHRMVNINEMSGRYSEIPEEYFIPEEPDMRGQGSINKQGSDGLIDRGEIIDVLDDIKYISKECFSVYHRNLESGLAKEMSRIVLPLSTYTQWDWTIDLHNLLHLFDVRSDYHAQKEIREYSDAILELVRPLVPHTISAWEDYSPYRKGVFLTRFEIDALRTAFSNNSIMASIPQIEPQNKYERAEWAYKLSKMGLLNFLEEKDNEE